MKKIYLILSGLVILIACKKLPEGPSDIPDTSYVPRTELGRMVSKAGSVAHVYADTTFLLATGVDETDIHLQTSDYKVEHVFILRVNLETPGVRMRLVLPGDKDSYVIGARQTPTEMISFVDKPGRRVVSSTLTDQAISFVAFDYDGLPIIRDSAYYRPHQAEFRDLSGSGVVVVRDGIVPLDFNAYSPWRHPRNVVGYTEDRKTLYFMICDGRQPTWSDGMLYWEMGEIMKSLGCEWASNLDGGGSAMLVIRHPSVDVYQLRNRACDDTSGVGAERAVVSCWMVTVDEP